MVIFMSSTLLLSLSAAILPAVIILAVSFKSGHFIKSVMLTLISGIGALFAVNILTPLTGVAISLNYISLTVSGIFGIPGVIALLFMH